jgi:hypothetical protein
MRHAVPAITALIAAGKLAVTVAAEFQQRMTVLH